jgi:hypothetical protein
MNKVLCEGWSRCSSFTYCTHSKEHERKISCSFDCGHDIERNCKEVKQQSSKIINKTVQ